MKDTERQDPRASFEQFHALYWSEVDAGKRRPIEDYLNEFPGIDDEIRAEYDEDLLSSPPLPHHDRIGRYVISGDHKQGGFGVVRVAIDSRTNRRVAVKTLLRRTDQVMPLIEERFEREVRILGQLRHDGICRVYDVVVEDECIHIVMEYVEGGTLFDRIAAARAQMHSTGSTWVRLDGTVDSLLDSDVERALRAPPGEDDMRPLVRTMENLAMAMHHAHEAGIVHRDLKPENILIRADGRPVVIDFGLALDLADPTRLTAAGATMGTLPYMAPEQIKGASDAIDRRTDVYALGVILYELLTLERPFPGHQPDRLAMNILIGVPLPPRKIVPRISRDLEAICLKAMSAEHDQRYATALDLALDLRRFRMGLTPLAPRSSWFRRLRRRARRHRVAISLVAVLAVGLAAVWVSYLVADRERGRKLEILSVVFEKREPVPPDLRPLWVAMVPDAKEREQTEQSPTQDRLLALLGTVRADDRRRLLFPAGRVAVVGLPQFRFIAEPDAAAGTYEIRLRGPLDTGEREQERAFPVEQAATENVVHAQPPESWSLLPGDYLWLVVRTGSGAPLAGAERFRIAMPTELADLRRAPSTGVSDLDDWLLVARLLDKGLAGAAAEQLRRDPHGAFAKVANLRDFHLARAEYMLGNFAVFEKLRRSLP